ncbi:hypothetical protein GUJ93_ZPchr0002g25753 [Zizania palustris]|uniref:Uncharacterized protein n=1 Tax=Zizania palustris TaxID=103762 RepID=A0A8J5RVS9_ZIZPA|nr:hypothetical protein GUJ93_ZPchr0002g25753 [Zizania palustris]
MKGLSMHPNPGQREREETGSRRPAGVLLRLVGIFYFGLWLAASFFGSLNGVAALDPRNPQQREAAQNKPGMMKEQKSIKQQPQRKKTASKESTNKICFPVLFCMENRVCLAASERSFQSEVHTKMTCC